MIQKAIFNPGDRVRLTKSGSDRYIQPYRGWGERGRLATVIKCGQSVRVRFDCRGAPKRPHDYIVDIYIDDLELVEPIHVG